MAKHHGHFGGSNGSALGWAMAVLAVSLCTSASAAPVGTQFQINTSNKVMKAPNISVAPDGSMVVVWEQKNSDTDKDVLARRFDAGGNALSGEFKVNSSNGEHKKPSVSVAVDGSFVVVWENKNSANDSDVLAQRYDAGGNPIGGEFSINSSGGEHKSPSISVATDGSFVVVWEKKNSDTDKDVLARRYGAAGNPLGAEFTINTSGGEHKNPRISIAANGSFVVTWEKKNSDTNKDVLAQRFDATGNTVGSQFQVNTSGGENGSPRIALASDGSFVVVWEKKNNNTDKDVLAQRYDASGAPTGSEFQINTSGAEQKKPSVAMADDGSFVVTWENKTAGNIIARSYSPSGTASSGETTVNTVSGVLKDPSIGMNTSGQYVIVWTDDSGGDIFGQLFGSASQKKIILWREVRNAA